MIMIKYSMLVQSSDSGCDSDVAKSWVVHMHLWHLQNPDSFIPEGRARIKIWNLNQPVLWKTKQTCSLTHNIVTQKCWEKTGCQRLWCVQQTAGKDVWKPIKTHTFSLNYFALWPPTFWWQCVTHWTDIWFHFLSLQRFVKGYSKLVIIVK